MSLHSSAHTSQAILLIRHGPSSHKAGLTPVRVQGMHAWRDAYDRAGIAPYAEPPASLIAAVAGCDLVISSDLPRALESAARLSGGRTIHRSALLRESVLALPPLPLLLPVLAWDALATIRWAYQILRRADATPAELQRATDAARWIHDLRKSSSVAVITHGVFRRLLARHFQGAGWQLRKPRAAYDHWSTWTLSRS